MIPIVSTKIPAMNMEKFITTKNKLNAKLLLSTVVYRRSPVDSTGIPNEEPIGITTNSIDNSTAREDVKKVTARPMRLIIWPTRRLFHTPILSITKPMNTPYTEAGENQSRSKPKIVRQNKQTFMQALRE